MRAPFLRVPDTSIACLEELHDVPRLRRVQRVPALWHDDLERGQKPKHALGADVDNLRRAQHLGLVGGLLVVIDEAPRCDDKGHAKLLTDAIVLQDGLARVELREDLVELVGDLPGSVPRDMRHYLLPSVFASLLSS